MKRETKKD